MVSAPQIREAIPGGRTQISGGDPRRSPPTRPQLANAQYGSLPLSFESSGRNRFPPLWFDFAARGLIAGAIGLAMVLLYC